VITVVNLRKAYGLVRAANGVTFEVPNGMVTGLLGPNGAGKTTTLRAVAGLLRPDVGSVTVDGHDVIRDPRAARRALGILPDSPGCYRRLTVREHVAYSAALHGLQARTAGPRVDAALRTLTLTALADRPSGQLSTGEARRMRLACALVHQPANVILDEPTSGLDVVSTRVLRAEIRRLAATGRAVLFSSHAMSEVAASCDRVVVLRAGQVAATGTPAELMAGAACTNLEDAFVAIVGTQEGLQSW
jgi:sodium transport system ATP-binding protein